MCTTPRHIGDISSLSADTECALHTLLGLYYYFTPRARISHRARGTTVTDIRESTKRAKCKDLPRSSASGELTLHFNYGKFTAVGINRYAERKPNNIARFFDLLHSRNEFTGALSLHSVLIVRYVADLRRYSRCIHLNPLFPMLRNGAPATSSTMKRRILKATNKHVRSEASIVKSHKRIG